MSFNHIITAKNCFLGYQPAFPIVKNLNIQIEKGEWIAILGNNGSGKTTFLRSLLGLIKALEGNLLVFGKIPEKINNSRIGYLAQWRELNETLNIRADTMLGATLAGERLGIPFLSKKNQARIADSLAQVGATEFSTQAFKNLSGGQKQRIRLAQSLLEDPHLLLLDEPLSYLDREYQIIFIELLETLRKKNNITILIATHDIKDMLPYLSRVLHFEQGNALFKDPTQISDAQLQKNPHKC